MVDENNTMFSQLSKVNDQLTNPVVLDMVSHTKAPNQHAII
jgi:hypothetical protein